jgi:hypothetical protein
LLSLHVLPSLTTRLSLLYFRIQLSLMKYCFSLYLFVIIIFSFTHLGVLNSALMCLKIDVRIYPGLQKEKKISSELHRPKKEKEKINTQQQETKKGFFFFFWKKFKKQLNKQGLKGKILTPR